MANIRIRAERNGSDNIPREMYDREISDPFQLTRSYNEIYPVPQDISNLIGSSIVNSDSSLDEELLEDNETSQL